ncbi:hypothetical protein SVIO_112190 [Streptomyces violaceusniger]|uniref:Uncharacterized protein n=1 Tax=Streptomyces violaceusniger TaxID=68280 RepID=A0A4D4LMP8_STRVO|nr:hypothetical protein SVIO_112190 [Streptomyces violaceusniger]
MRPQVDGLAGVGLDLCAALGQVLVSTPAAAATVSTSVSVRSFWLSSAAASLSAALASRWARAAMAWSVM